SRPGTLTAASGNVMKPGFDGVRTPWIRGSMASAGQGAGWLLGGAGGVLLAGDGPGGGPPARVARGRAPRKPARRARRPRREPRPGRAGSRPAKGRSPRMEGTDGGRTAGVHLAHLRAERVPGGRVVRGRGQGRGVRGRACGGGDARVSRRGPGPRRVVRREG